MNNWGKLYFIATVITAFIALCIILYRETNVFKTIIDGIVTAYNWLKNIGR